MIGRPTKSEAAAYYFAYIDQVAGDDVQAILAKQLGELTPGSQKTGR